MPGSTFKLYRLKTVLTIKNTFNEHKLSVVIQVS